MFKKWASHFKKHTLTGISYMIPVVVAGGICIGLARIFGGAQIAEGSFAYILNQIGSAAIGFTVPVIAAGIAYSMGGRPGIAPGLAIGFIANSIKSGFLGGLIGGFLVGAAVLLMKKYIKLPKSIQPLMPVLIIPVLGTLSVGLIFYYAIGMPLAFFQTSLTNWLMSLQDGSRALLGAIIGGMRIDMGGPCAQSAAMFSNAMLTEGIFGPKAANIVSGMTPPLGVALAVLIAKKRFNAAEIQAAKTAVPLGLCYITEGVFPFLATDPIRIITSCTIGSATAGALAMLMGVEAPVPHGGVFAIPFMTNPLGFIIALVAGTLVTALILVAIKPKNALEAGGKEADINIDDLNF
nr:PTS fructose transporter subunit IIC [Maliibacterium massiliense]